MRNKTSLLAAFCAITLSGTAQVARQVPDPSLAPASYLPYQVVATTENSKVWQRAAWARNPVDGSTIWVTNSYTEIKTAMARQVNGIWTDCTAQFQITPNGAEATNSLHNVMVLGDISAPGSVTLVTPDGKKLVSNILGIDYRDQSSGQSVWIAETTNSVGQLMPNGSEILFTNALAGLDADVTYQNSVLGLEQFVLLRQQLPPCTDWGLQPSNVVLEVITEFTGSDSPQVTTRTVDGQWDDYIDFGRMQMARGYGFALGAETNKIVVAKRWVTTTDGRVLLDEQVPLTAILPYLQTLPPPPPATASITSPSSSILHKLASHQLLPPRRLAKAKTPSVRLATRPLGGKGLALDYATLTSQTNLTLQCDTTYFLNGTVNISGTTYAEGGSVLKVAKSPSATLVTSNLVCLTTTNFRPVAVSASDDNNLGDTISGSTGSPSGFYGGIAIDLSAASNPTVCNFRFCYMSNALAGTGITLRDCQFIQCFNGINTHMANPKLYNVLIWKVGEFLASSGGQNGDSITAINVTAHYCTNFTYDLTGTVNLTNCLFACVTNWQAATAHTNTCAFLNSDSGIFQVVGGASHYLADQSPHRTAGNVNIDATLLADLANKTTYPPLVYSNAAISVDTTFGAQAQRESATSIDIGWAYDPLDWVFGGCDGDANLTFDPGTAIGWFRTSSGWYHAGHGIHMANNKIITFNGQATEPDYWVRCSVVQEGCNGIWQGGYGPGGITGWASSTATAPEVHAYFLRCSMFVDEANHIRDDNGWLTVRAASSTAPASAAMPPTSITRTASTTGAAFFCWRVKPTSPGPSATAPGTAATSTSTGMPTQRPSASGIAPSMPAPFPSWTSTPETPL